jgi:hypothetical protein
LAAALREAIDAPSRLQALARNAPQVKSIEQDAGDWSRRYRAIIRTADGVAMDAS